MLHDASGCTIKLHAPPPNSGRQISNKNDSLLSAMSGVIYLDKVKGCSCNIMHQRMLCAGG